MADEPEELLATRRFRVLRKREIGRDGRVHTRDIVEHPGAVTILPVLDDGRICLIRNERIAVGAILIELPAGTLEPGEDPALAAERELAEETGYRAQSLQKLCEFYTSPGILSERMHVYLARQLQAGEPRLEPGETIEPMLVDWSEAMHLAHSGAIQDAKTLVALLYYDRFERKQV